MAKIRALLWWAATRSNESLLGIAEGYKEREARYTARRGKEREREPKRVVPQLIGGGSCR